MTVPLLLEMAVSGHGSRVALGSLPDGLTFEDLARRALVGAAIIGDRAPAHVAFVGRNGPAYVQAFLSAAVAGIPFAPLNYRLATAQLRAQIAELGEGLVIADEAYAGALGKDPVLTSSDFTQAAAVAQAPAGNRSEAGTVGDMTPAVLLFTSGTTARPKAVVLRHGNLASYIFQTVEFSSAAPAEAALISVPPYHVAAVGATLSNVFAGRRVVHLPDFDPRRWVGAVRAERITSAMLVPTMLARVLDVLGDGPADLPSLRLISYGGARMPRPVIERALRVLPDVDFVNAYGLTETSSTIALLGPADHRDAVASPDAQLRLRLVSAGRLVPGVEAEIRDEAGTVVRPGQPGLLWVRGRQVSGEYRGLGSALDAEGWFPTGDSARLDADGFLFVEGRADDTIIRGGENISPAEIEDVLLSHPGVREAAVIGTPDDEWGERICAVVVREPDCAPGSEPTDEELRAFVRERLRGSRTPDEVVWRSELPQTETGKLLRRQLVAELSPATAE
jgi:acyl-CoA synthetase (AMP-forming)/AMP-acid ligase II